jgi:hypothetical protein
MPPAEIQNKSGEPISSFVFEGTIMQLQASTEPSFPASAQTAIVKVNKLLYASEALRQYTGQQITLCHTGLSGVRQGQEAIFFTDVLIYGQSLVVQEVEPRADSGEVARQGRLLPPERHLQQRIKATDLIIQGEVLNVEPVEVPDQPLSEHNPWWAQAEVSVGRVLKGDVPADKVTVFFPRSTDYLWYYAPKFHPSQRGTWLLHFAHIQDLNKQGYVALDPLDFHPEDNADRVTALLDM